MRPPDCPHEERGKEEKAKAELKGHPMVPGDEQEAERSVPELEACPGTLALEACPGTPNHNVRPYACTHSQTLARLVWPSLLSFDGIMSCTLFLRVICGCREAHGL